MLQDELSNFSERELMDCLNQLGTIREKKLSA